MNFIEKFTPPRFDLRLKLFFICLLLINSICIFSQSIPYTCGNTEPPLPDPPVNESSDCFDVDSIITNCIPIYLRVNVHYFLDDDCSGTFLADGSDTMRLFDGDIPITNID